ncbi:MAG: cytochrome c3 family protein [Sphingomonadaceae bacterium]|nr:cytochrome c3 family protein [Sphingomonadaceae bacterium]
MAFIVRHVSRTAGGREIVRARRIEKDALTVGRAADSDVHLTDLGVMLHHATITRRGEADAMIATEKDVPVKVDGRSASRAAINARRGGAIRIGPHRLVVSLGEGEEAGALVVTVTRDEEVTAPERDAHGLAGTVPGKRRSAWMFALLILAAFLAWPVWTFYQSRGVEQRPDGFHADTMWSTGALSSAHANLENDCQACHQQAFVSVRDSSCLSCHADVHDHADRDRMARAVAPPDFTDRVGLVFADFFNRPRQACVECHTEHEGAGAMAPTPQRFCAECHTGLESRLTDTRLLDAGDFARDHPEFRPVVMTSPGNQPGARPSFARLSLDRRPQEDTGLKFPHELHLSTTNGVARMAQRLSRRYGFGESLGCADCHTPTADGVRFMPVTMEGDCQMCHSLAFDRIGGTVRTLRHGEPAQVVADIRAFYRGTAPPRPIDLSGMARRRPGGDNRARTVGRYQFAVATRYSGADRAIRRAFSDGGVCFDCHRVQAPPRGAEYRILPVRQIARYMRRGWFDHAAHVNEDCTECHAAERSESASDILIPGIATCRDCHGGEDAHGDLVPSTCALCHNYHADDGAPYLVRGRDVRGGGRDAQGRRAREQGDRGR